MNWCTTCGRSLRTCCYTCPDCDRHEDMCEGLPGGDELDGMAAARDRAIEDAPAEQAVERALKLQEGSVLAREVLRLRALADATTADPLGTTCIDCGEAITDETRTVPAADGNLLHVGCGDDGMDLEAQGEMADQLDAAQAAIQRVRDLHASSLEGRWCATCRGPYPCRTVRALDGDTTGETR